MKVLYKNMNTQDLLKLRKELIEEFQSIKKEGLNLDMSVGKPSIEQIKLSMGMMNALSSESNYLCEDGTDCRNYGVLNGIFEARKLMADIMEVPVDNTIVLGNSTLNNIYDMVSRAMTHGILGHIPWSKQNTIKFLCPAPGYSRHFRIAEHFGIEMIMIPMTKTGPDMNIVEKYVTEDENVKGIFCVPKYSNPQGITYSNDTVCRFAKLKPAAKDFRIYWDDAYCIHDLYEEEQSNLLEILAECEKNGNANLVYKFLSTSKITFPGAGISAIAASKENIKSILEQLSIQTIGPNKINQLRHVRYFKDIKGVREHMKKHAEILRPKFEIALEILKSELDGLGVGEWTSPKGGYFISFDSMDGCAKAIVEKTRELGIILTSAGATFPYGYDPKDRNIRIAPSFPTTNELKKAIKAFALCVKIVSIDKLLEN